MAITTSIFIAWNTSFKNTLATSSTELFLTDALITAAFAPIPKNPEEPSSTTS